MDKDSCDFDFSVQGNLSIRIAFHDFDRSVKDWMVASDMPSATLAGVTAVRAWNNAFAPAWARRIACSPATSTDCSVEFAFTIRFPQAKPPDVGTIGGCGWTHSVDAVCLWRGEAGRGAGRGEISHVQPLVSS